MNVNASTKITRKGVAIKLTDIKVGDRVEARGTRVDDHTILAQQIEVVGRLWRAVFGTDAPHAGERGAKRSSEQGAQ